jgi:phosphoglycerate kinase
MRWRYEARRIQAEAEQQGKRLLVLVDVVIGRHPAEDVQRQVVSQAYVPAGRRILDIGPDTVAIFRRELKHDRTIVFNGPLSVAEFLPFAYGTYGMIVKLAEATHHGATTIIGGGDTVVVVEAVGLAARMSHVSTGGGAALELLEGRTLPGVAALQDRALALGEV